MVAACYWLPVCYLFATCLLPGCCLLVAGYFLPGKKKPPIKAAIGSLID